MLQRRSRLHFGEGQWALVGHGQKQGENKKKKGEREKTGKKGKQNENGWRKRKNEK